MTGLIIRKPTYVSGGLTDAERDQMKIHAQKWIDIAMRTGRTDKPALIAAVKQLYKVSSLDEPIVVVVSSPMVMAVAGAIAAVYWAQHEVEAVNYAANRDLVDALYGATVKDAHAEHRMAVLYANYDAVHEDIRHYTHGEVLNAVQVAQNQIASSASEALTATLDAAFDFYGSATEAARDVQLSAEPADAVIDDTAWRPLVGGTYTVVDYSQLPTHHAVFDALRAEVNVENYVVGVRNNLVEAVVAAVHPFTGNLAKDATVSIVRAVKGAVTAAVQHGLLAELSSVAAVNAVSDVDTSAAIVSHIATRLPVRNATERALHPDTDLRGYTLNAANAAIFDTVNVISGKLDGLLHAAQAASKIEGDTGTIEGSTTVAEWSAAIADAVYAATVVPVRNGVRFAIEHTLSNEAYDACSWEQGRSEPYVSLQDTLDEVVVTRPEDYLATRLEGAERDTTNSTVYLVTAATAAAMDASTDKLLLNLTAYEAEAVSGLSSDAVEAGLQAAARRGRGASTALRPSRPIAGVVASGADMDATLYAARVATGEALGLVTDNSLGVLTAYDRAVMASQEDDRVSSELHIALRRASLNGAGLATDAIRRVVDKETHSMTQGPRSFALRDLSGRTLTGVKVDQESLAVYGALRATVDDALDAAIRHGGESRTAMSHATRNASDTTTDWGIASALSDGGVNAISAVTSVVVDRSLYETFVEAQDISTRELAVTLSREKRLDDALSSGMRLNMDMFNMQLVMEAQLAPIMDVNTLRDTWDAAASGLETAELVGGACVTEEELTSDGVYRIVREVSIAVGVRPEAVFSVLPRFGEVYSGGNMWAAFDAYLTAARDILGLRLPEHTAYAAWEAAAKLGGFRYMHKKFCLVCDFPDVLKKDAQHRPHCEDGPSHRWSDGWSLWHIDGHRVDEQLVMRPHTQTIAQIESEESQDVKVIRIERYGWDRYLRDTNSECLDEFDNELEGTMEALFVTPDGDKRLVATCATGRLFSMGVPEHIDTCDEARLWRQNNRRFNVLART